MKKIVLCLLVSLLLAACQQKAERVANENSTDTSALKVAKAKEAKPGAQVSLASADVIVVAANKTSEIEILLRAQLGTGDMLVELNPGEGLQISGITQPYRFTVTDDGLYKLGLQVSALNNGRFYLNIKATINHGDTASSRILAVIVQVGDQVPTEDPATAANEKLSSDLAKKASEAVISLPAEERISNQ